MTLLQKTLLTVAATSLIFPGVAHGLTFKASAPVKLTIPAIHVSAKIESVGLTRSKKMRAPSSGSTVAVYNRGTQPGQAGSVVIYGHFSGQHFEPTVFANLGKLRPGNHLTVTDQRGNILTYRVSETHLYPYNQLSYDSLAMRSSSSHLNLYTCGGQWDPRHHRYTHFQVVYTDLVSVVTKH